MTFPCPVDPDMLYGYPGSVTCSGQNRVLNNARGCGPYPGLAGPAAVPSGRYVGAPGKYAGTVGAQGLQGLGACACGGRQTGGITVLEGLSELRMRPMAGIDWGDAAKFLCQFVASALGVTADYFKTRSEAQLKLDLSNATQLRADLQAEVQRWGGVEIVATILKTACTSENTTTPTTAPTAPAPTNTEIQQFLQQQQLLEAQRQAQAEKTRQYLLIGGIAAAGLAVVVLLTR